ncbi:hypothetical protein [Haloarchaeobius sp. DT45]|uniref:hypothetical protein n=1 Tax=Haloarchaeobius sp. DT45 TaxID=3446116 RepID=UPI003F6B9FD7
MDWDDPASPINRGLLYEVDERRIVEPDDEEALEVFLSGWSKAVPPEGEDYGERAFETLSWPNLGYRLGLLFGPTSRDLKEDLYHWCVKKQNA